MVHFITYFTCSQAFRTLTIGPCPYIQIRVKSSLTNREVVMEDSMASHGKTIESIGICHSENLMQLNS
jgi:hypothetical protein